VANVFIIVFFLFYLYALLYKPKIAAIIFFTLTGANVVIYIAGIQGLSVKALTGALLFLRIIIEKDPDHNPSFFNSVVARYMMLFIFYTFLISMAYDLFDLKLVNRYFLAFITAYCGWYFFYKNKNHDLLKTSLVISAVICLGDLVYTYAFFGSFPVQRVFMIITGVPGFTGTGAAGEEFLLNHNFYGFVCGACFVFLFNDFLNSKTSNRATTILLPVTFMGVIMSTSRSSLLVILLVAFFLMVKASGNREQSRKAYKLIFISLGCFFLCIFLIQSMNSLFDLESDFIDKFTARLIDEPIAVINKHLGYKYDAQNLDSMEWREEASSLAYSVYMDLPFYQQIFGLGYGSFLERNFGNNGLNAHNGILLMLIETGLLGLILYFSMMINVIWQSIRLKNISPLFSCLLFILLFAVGHNNELTSPVTFLFIAALAAENEYLSVKETEEEADTEISSLLHEY